MMRPGDEGEGIHLEAHASGDAHIHQAGRDQHVHYADGVHGRRRATAGRLVRECPYPGLAAFGPEQAGWFFGRDGLVAELIAHLDERLPTGGVQIVVAPSGAGKSSLLRAGLVPALDRAALPGSDGWPKQALTPTAEPLRELTAVDREQGSPRVVVVDQFEELFTLCTDDEQRHAFIDRLLEIGENGGLVVIGVRADFYPACADHPRLRAALQDAPLVVGPMSEEELREAILFPAKAVELDIEPGLVEVLLRDLGVTAKSGTSGYEAGRLPLLAHALRVSWQQRSGTTLTVQGYQDTGGIRNAVATTADRVFTGLDEAGRKAARSVFLRLIKIGDGTEDTRRRVPIAELTNAAAIVEAFSQARLLTRRQDDVEITHETLLHSWPRLRAWINDDRAGRLTQQNLEEAATAWDRADRDSSLLFWGSRLEIAQTWAENAPAGELSQVGETFLAACGRARRRAARRRTRLIAVLTVLTVVASTAALLFLRQQSEAVHQRDLAIYNRVLTEADQLRGTDVSLSAQLDLVAHRLRPGEETATRLVTAANMPLSTPLAGHTDVVTAVAFSPDGRILITASMDEHLRVWNVSDATRPVLLGQAADSGSRVHAMAFSPDGRTVATGSMSGAVRLWNVADPARPVELGGYLKDRDGFRGQVGTIDAVAFSPDGHTLAAASEQGTVQLWNVSDPARRESPSEVFGHHKSVKTVAFSSDGRTLATGGDDFTVRLWNIADFGKPAPLGEALKEHRDTVNAVAFSPDGRTLASGSDDSTLRLWDVSDPASPASLGGSANGHLGSAVSSVKAVAFSRDGRTVATGSADSTTRLWNVSDPAQPKGLGEPLRGHTGAVDAVAFSPDGRTLATGSLDQSVRLWNIPGSTLTGGTSAIYSVAFSPDGRTLATGEGDSVVRLWDVSNPLRPASVGPPLTGATKAVVSVAFSRDGRTLASGSTDSTVRLWNVADPARPVSLGEPLKAHTGAVNSVAFSPDKRTLATGGSDSTVRLWDISDVGKPQALAYPLTTHTSETVLTGRTDAIFSVAFSPDGRTLATGSSDFTATLWDVSDRTRPVQGAPLTGHTQPIYSVAFSPDGQRVATGSADSTVRLWNISDPARSSRLPTDHAGTVSSVAFARDGRTLATGSTDSTVRLWNISDPARPLSLGRPLGGHTDAVVSVAFSPDGNTLASGGADLSVRLTGLNVDRDIDRICAVTGATLTSKEWERYVGGDVPFAPPCG
ncbi:hypothetical protein ACFQ05_31680 [Amycolatopsis umgeniensis]|uniref:WD40 repeat protein n=1 Tax=Amycolatopsis umgeniensis TaxID=336628 RepID=A0A841BEZ4_9PSEU|nr:WD40 repeat domain-containing protein [Amycolatopsis umgeniensis]MBB5857471.1 WD40 repeat protein [Amycolatopsis umgeniensis]